LNKSNISFQEVSGKASHLKFDQQPQKCRWEPQALLLTRKFTYHPGDKFELEIANLADPYGKVALAKLLIKGNMRWKGEHPIATGAHKVDFVADEGYEVTPLLQGFADVLNQLAVKATTNGKLIELRVFLKKSFAPFGLGEGQIFQNMT